MNEKINENLEGAVFEKEQKETVVPQEKIEEIVPAEKKEELLQNIYKKPVITEEKDEKNPTQDKKVSNLIKEYFSVGIDKTVKKARKVLDAFGLDMFHDELTKKNKSDKR